MSTSAVAPSFGTPVPVAAVHESPEARIRRSLAQDSSYAYCFRFIRFSSRNGVLTVSGCLPSFYLKQVLISHLQKVEGLTRIDDRVDVISSNGLSSERQRDVA
jgi:hypothetical protein